MGIMIQYVLPHSWIAYGHAKIAAELARARGAILALQNMPYQKSWVDSLQEIELKREIAGTSRIEGADFTERELEEALQPTATLQTRSQRQARAAKYAYDMISEVPDDRPISSDLIRMIHVWIVTDCDDDHCAPGRLRESEQNGVVGNPRHRGVRGGADCELAFDMFVNALMNEYAEHDPIIQAIAAHYHFAAMHPFLDGNGRTARALEALLLRRAGLKNECFIAMSNYYYDEKTKYLGALAATRAANHDLSPFLKFALAGVETQCFRVLKEIKLSISKALYRDLMYDLFNRLRSKRKRVLHDRQLEILKVLLANDEMKVGSLYARCEHKYATLRDDWRAFVRDINGLSALRAIKVRKDKETEQFYISVRLDWPTETTETTFMQALRALPTGKTFSFLNRDTIQESDQTT